MTGYRAAQEGVMHGVLEKIIQIHRQSQDQLGKTHHRH